MKPIVGITMDDDRQLQSTVTNLYIEGVVKYGGIPVMLPLHITKEEDLNQLINLCDGFLFTGGGDIEPSYYQEEVGEECGSISPLRDKMEITLMQLLAKEKKPVLGICRGSQVMNVALGGNLYQDLPSQFKGIVPLNHKPKAPYHHPIHDVEIKEKSLLFNILQKNKIKVNSIHHQGFNSLGKGLKAVAAAPCTLVEAIEMENHPFFIGVQWHPEKMPQEESSQKILQKFMAACGKNE